MIILKSTFMFSTWSISLIVVISMLNKNITDNALKKTEDYANNLEMIVKERTAELNITLDKVKIINEELMQKNNIAERDLNLATRVQTGIYPQKILLFPAGIFLFSARPLRELPVIYKIFFVENDKFTGVGLFDVSGHGISAGLITLLAKSIVSRNFTSNYEVKLKDIIEKINGELFAEIGSVDNYLAGVLLRFKDDHIEYVNCGHADILLRKKENKSVILVSPKDKEFI